MALWGKADSIYSPGTVTVNYTDKTITGTGTSFRSAGITTGTVISIGAGATLGQAVVSGITSETVISIASTQFLSTGIVGAAYTMSQKPIYTLHDTNYDLTPTDSTGLTNAIYGVDEYEAAANSATGSKYGVSHAGWVGVHTYVDMHGTLRVKSETLVAMSGISTLNGGTYTATGDANDDSVFPDRYIAISVQPQSASVGVGTTVTFSVTAAAVPASSLSYQWERSTNGGTSYANIGGATSSSVSIANTNTANNGYLYRVQITSAGGASATSNAATLTVS
jgi:hypothetical protein